MDCVIIPAYDRPGFLHITLELLLKNPDLEDKHFFFAVDHGYDPRIPTVIMNQMRGLSYEIYYTPNRGLVEGKQSYNLLNAYREALKLKPTRVYLVEDDIFVANDFFKWHEAVHTHDIAVSSACKNNNAKDPVTGDLEAFYLKGRGEYQSLGVCWSAAKLELLLAYVEDWYFKTPSKYILTKFPDSSISPFYAEQDGLIRRLLNLLNWPVAYPHYPRAYHAGFQGYHRVGKHPLPLDLEEQIAVIRRVAFSEAAMKWVTVHPEHYEDSVPVPLENPEWTTQKLVSLSP